MTRPLGGRVALGGAAIFMALAPARPAIAAAPEIAGGLDGAWHECILYNPKDGRSYEASMWLKTRDRLVVRGRPRVLILGGLLGALFGGIEYTRDTGGGP
jgi:hypothetical protein